jgi:hypothetical protein
MRFKPLVCFFKFGECRYLGCLQAMSVAFYFLKKLLDLRKANLYQMQRLLFILFSKLLDKFSDLFPLKILELAF